MDETVEVVGDTYDRTQNQGLFTDLKEIDRLSRLIDVMSQSRDLATIAQNPTVVCRLPSKNYDTTNFDLDPKRKALLVDAAYQITKQHLQNRFVQQNQNEQ